MQRRQTGFDDSLGHSLEKGGTLIERKIDFEYLATSRVLEKKKRYKNTQTLERNIFILVTLLN